MNIWSRRVYFIIIIIVFLVIAPLLLLYAAGFRYDFQKNKIVQVGIISLETKPRSASIYINDKLFKKKTPTVLNNLLPGRYSLKIIKNGYHSWQKTVNVQSGLATVYPDIKLFKKVTATTEIDQNVTLASISDDLKKLAYISQDNLKIININDLKLTFSKKITESVSQILWSPDTAKLLLELKNKDDYLFIDLNKESVNYLSGVIGLTAKNIKWDLKDNKLIYGVNNSSLFQVNLETKEKKKIIDSIITDYSVINSTILFVEQLLVKKINLDEPNEEILILELNRGARPQFLKKNHSIIPLLDTDNHKLYLINQLTNEYQVINERVDQAQWSKDMDKLLLYNKAQLWALDINNNKEYLLLRTSQTIDEVHWHPSNNHVIASHKQQLEVIELDDYDRNIYVLLKTKTKNIILDDDGKYVYFLDNNNTLSRITIL